MTQSTFHRRPLPDDLVAFSSAEGKRLFREALDAGAMEGWFPLAEQFHTQADPAFCGLGSLVVALNALGIDPQRLWKGPWRWFSEEMLDCCVALDEVRARGLTMTELACLARCNGAEATATHASASTLETLRGDIADASTTGQSVVLAAYSRKVLGQTGSGHYSPIAGHHAGRDLTLLLDVARFKYPPHWVSITRLHEAMTAIDPDTSKPRGWIVLRRKAQSSGLLFSLTCRNAKWQDVVSAFEAAFADGTDLAHFAEAGSTIAPYLEWREPFDAAHGEWMARMKRELEQSAIGLALAPRAGADTAALAALHYVVHPTPHELGDELANEIDRVREQLGALRAVRPRD